MKLSLGRDALEHPDIRRLLLTLNLLVDRRGVTLVIIDALILLGFVLSTLLGEGDSASVYFSVILIPSLLLGLPVLSDAVALERRAGSLDLALSSSGSTFYFERRMLTLASIMLLQAVLVLIVARLTLNPFYFIPALVQTVIVLGTITVTTFFWSLRLQTPGAVLFASLVTFAVLGKWFFSSPIYSHHDPRNLADIALIWTRQNLVLLFASVLLYLYSRRRLARPGKLLS